MNNVENINENVNTNTMKDLKKLSYLTNLAKGHRTINGFSADCRANADYISDIINMKIGVVPQINFLKIIAENSQDRVSLKELTVACGYSNYENSDLTSIKNIYVRRGWFCYADFGDKGIDSEYCGYRLVLIISNDIGNKYSPNIKVINVTSRSKKSLKTHVQVNGNCGLHYESIIACESVNTISKRRLKDGNGNVQQISQCPEYIMRQVEVALMKADGIIDINMTEEEAISILENMNNLKVNNYENNYNYNNNKMPQPAFCN